MRARLSVLLALLMLGAGGSKLCAQQKELFDASAFRKALQTKLSAGKVEDATAYFKETLQRVENLADKKSVREDFLRGMARLGKGVQAYRAVPKMDTGSSFRVLADQLVASGHKSALQALVRERSLDFDDGEDPYIGVYRGQLAFEDGKYADADAAWTLAFKAINDEALLEQFHRRRVRAKFALGKIIEAYNDLPPQSGFQSTNTLLADLCIEHDKKNELRKLLEAFKKRETNFRTLSPYLVHIHSGENMATFLKTIEIWKEGMKPGAYALGSVCSELAKEGRAIEAYTAAPDKRPAFKSMHSTLRIYGKFPTLRSLIAAHRKADPADPETDYAEGELMLELHQLDKAIGLLDRARKQDPASYRARGQYLEACRLAGKGVQTYKDLGCDDHDFGHLAIYYSGDRDAPSLEALLKARPAGEGFSENEIWKYQAKIKILTGKPDAALELFLEHRKKNAMSPFPAPIAARERQFEESDFMLEMATVGQEMAVYRIARYPQEAFASLSRYYVEDYNFRDPPELRKRAQLKALAALVNEHREKYPHDPGLPQATAHLDLLRGSVDAAEPIFRAALAKMFLERRGGKKDFARDSSLRMDKHRLRDGLARALIQQGRALEQYRADGSDPQAFAHVARLCVQDGAAGELDALLALHRKSYPKDPGIRRFEGEVAFLKGDYEAAWKVFKDATDAYSERPKAMRCLVRLKRNAEAVRMAEDWETNSCVPNPTPLILAHAAAGDVKQTLRLMQIHAKRYQNLATFYSDPDLGPRLRGDAMKKVREQFPEPGKK